MLPLARRFSPAFLATLAVLLAALHGVLALTAQVEKSMTADEIAHLTAGRVYWERGDFRLQPENGNLPQRLAGLPLGLLPAPLPPPAGAAWETADVWEYGHDYFYRSGQPAGEMLFFGRSMIALASALLVLLVMAWSKARYGWRGAAVSGVLAAFSPTLLAHGALATSDTVMALLFLASVGAWWWHLGNPGMGRALVSSVVIGLAFVGKFSAVLLPPMMVLMGVVWAWHQSRNSGGWRPWVRVVRSLVLHALVAGAVIWSCYGFRYQAFAPEFAAGAHFNLDWDGLLAGLGLPGAVIERLRAWQLLPEAWLYGLTFVLQFSRARGAFLQGEYSVTGWVSFFPWTFLLKTTLPLLLLLVVAVIAVAKKKRAGAAAELLSLTPLVVLFLVYWATSLASNLNIGHRHILPTYPVLFILLGSLGRFLSRRTLVAGGVVLALVVAHVAESWRIRPHYLAYFNPLAGGPENGWRHLVDSSLDWGQDLPGLKRWLDEQAGNDRVYLSYFGTGSPAYEGIEATLLPTLPVVGTPRAWHRLEPGLYAVSATMLQHVYSTVRGDWTLEFEREYQQLRLLEPAFLAFDRDPSRADELQPALPAERWRALGRRYEILRFARLCHYLRVREPEAVIHYTIFVHRLTAEELAAVLEGPASRWQEAIDAARSQGRL